MTILTPVSHLCNDHNFEAVVELSDGLEIRERTLGFKHAKIMAAHIDIDITSTWDHSIQQYLYDFFANYPNLKLVTLQTTRVCQGEKLVDGIFQIYGEVHTRDQLLFNAQKNSSWLKDNCDASIGIENNNFYPSPAYQIITEGEFLCELCDSCDVGFLLDLAHAFVSSVNKRTSVNAYISSLPLSRLLQIHICQPTITGPFSAVDAHDAPSDPWLNWAVTMANTSGKPVPITVEYYRDVMTLIDTLTKLKAIISS